jgi:hypothetical protein
VSPPTRQGGPHRSTNRQETVSPPSVAVTHTMARQTDSRDHGPRVAAWYVEVTYPFGVRRFVFLKSERASGLVRRSIDRGHPATKARVLLVPAGRGGES